MPTVAVSGGESVVNVGAAGAGDTVTVKGPAVALGVTPLAAITL